MYNPLFVFLTTAILSAASIRAQSGSASRWLTTSDKTSLLRQLPGKLPFKPQSATGYTIEVNDRESYQAIDGFGFALTGGSAQHIIRMSPAARAALLKELFTRSGNNIGISYLRLSIGASDLNEKVFSYNDLPPGETDVEMKQFNLGPDLQDVIPVTKEILALYPGIKILGSPWSPPVWMKTIADARGGRLKPEYYAAYATYFVKYIQQMKAAGIIIDAITVQNEPLHPGNNPSLLLPAPDEAAFIRDHLGPAFKAAGIHTRIILYDHNADRPDYPISIMDDPAANQYVDGSGFHLYGGRIEALSEVHDAHPDKHIYFTEQMLVDRPGSTGMNIAGPVKRIIIGATRNWSRNVLLWNLAADPENKPFTDRGGCDACQGAVTIDGDKVSRNVAYYAIAHVSKFVVPGSIRIGSRSTDSLATVAFKTPSGTIVLLVSNTGKADQAFNILYHQKRLSAKLQAGAVATYTW